MFSGFSQKADSALQNAIHCAEGLGHTYVGSEHILGGILKDPTSVASVVLSSQKITYQTFYEAVASGIGIGIPTSLSENDFTPRARRIISLALTTAASRDGVPAGTEHLLIAVLREQGSFANRLLIKMGLSVSQVYGELTGNISQSSTEKGIRHREKSGPQQKGSLLNRFGRDLTAAAACGKTDPVTGRDGEIDRVIRILCRKNKNNPCLIGEPGVGKTAVAEGLAQRIVAGDVPDVLKNTTLYSLELTSVVAGAKYRGDFEERIKNIADEVINAGNIILFIDEIHNLIGAGSAEGAIDAANILKPVLARGELRIIGATTYEEYRKNIEKDAALERRFQTVSVNQPDEEATLKILRSLRGAYESFHGVKITDDALKAAVSLSVRYITDRFLPDKAIDLIDEAAAGVGIEKGLPSPELKELEGKLKTAAAKKIKAVNMQKFEEAAAFRDEEMSLKTQIEAVRAELSEEMRIAPVVDAGHITAAVSCWTNIPVGVLQEDERERLKSLEKTLSEAVIGQDAAVKRLSSAVRRGFAGLADPDRPVGVFLFCGPTGVGKTELAKALAAAVFGGKDALIKVDMSEYSEKHSVSRLIGAPPGYTGFDDGGQLVNRIRKRPYSLLLFDEIEKAHPDVFSFLLPVLEDGILTSSDGKRADCRNCIIIMTSNAGGAVTDNTGKKLGFGESSALAEEKFIKNTVERELKKIFSPEFRGRIDETVVFSPLSADNIRKIAEKMLNETKKRLNEKGIEFIFTEDTVRYIAEKGSSRHYGARDIRGVIVREIETPVSEILCSGEDVTMIKAEIRKGEVTLQGNAAV